MRRMVLFIAAFSLLAVPASAINWSFSTGQTVIYQTGKGTFATNVGVTMNNVPLYPYGYGYAGGFPYGTAPQYQLYPTAVGSAPYAGLGPILTPALHPSLYLPQFPVAFYNPWSVPLKVWSMVPDVRQGGQLVRFERLVLPGQQVIVLLPVGHYKWQVMSEKTDGSHLWRHLPFPVEVSVQASGGNYWYELPQGFGAVPLGTPNR